MQRAEPSRRRPPSASRPIVLAWVVMFALAFALRAGGAWVAPFSPAPGDPAIAAADAVASNLARGSGFTLETAQGLKPTAAVPPVVPWLMSLAYRGLGHRPLAMLLLREHGILTVHFAALPPGTDALLLKFVPPETLARFGGADRFAEAVDSSLGELASLVRQPDAVRRLLSDPHYLRTSKDIRTGLRPAS